MLNRINRNPIPAQAKTEEHAKIHMTLTVDELAEELNISRPTAYELVKLPDFPAFNIGHRVLVNRAGLQRWIDRQCEQKAA